MCVCRFSVHGGLCAPSTWTQVSRNCSLPSPSCSLVNFMCGLMLSISVERSQESPNASQKKGESSLSSSACQNERCGESGVTLYCRFHPQAPHSVQDSGLIGLIHSHFFLLLLLPLVLFTFPKQRPRPSV